MVSSTKYVSLDPFFVVRHETNLIIMIIIKKLSTRLIMGSATRSAEDQINLFCFKKIDSALKSGSF